MLKLILKSATPDRRRRTRPPIQDTTRSFQCNWGKRGQSRFWIGIKPYSETKKYGPEIPQNQKERMIRPWVELPNSQYEQLKELRKKAGRSLSAMIREAVSSFVTKTNYSISMGLSHLPKASRDNCRRVTAYLSHNPSPTNLPQFVPLIVTNWP